MLFRSAPDDTCRNCGRRGHWAKDCWQPRRSGTRAFLAQAEEDDEEPALLMAQVCDIPAPAMKKQQSNTPVAAMMDQQSNISAQAMMEQQSNISAPAMKVQQSDARAPAMVLQQSVTPAPAMKDSTTTAPEYASLHVDEQKAKAYLGTSSDNEQIEGWYFDAGAVDEEEGWDWAAEGSEYFDNNFDIECIIRHSARGPSQVSSSGEDGPRSSRHGAQGASASAPPSPPSAPATSVATPAVSAATPATPEFVTPLADDDDRLDAAHGDTPIRYRIVENLTGEEPVPGPASRNLDCELHLASMGEPCSFEEAEGDKAWQAAMCEEIEAVERNKTW